MKAQRRAAQPVETGQLPGWYVRCSRRRSGPQLLLMQHTLLAACIVSAGIAGAFTPVRSERLRGSSPTRGGGELPLDAGKWPAGPPQSLGGAGPRQWRRRGAQVIFSREFLKEVTIGEKQVQYIVNEARKGRVQGHRAELFAVRAAKVRSAAPAADSTVFAQRPARFWAGTAGMNAGDFVPCGRSAYTAPELRRWVQVLWDNSMLPWQS